jgi:soluble lytic murein transglycosylase-like protein
MTVVGICAAFVLAGGAAELVLLPRPLAIFTERVKEGPRPALSQPELEALLAKVAKSLDPSLRSKLAEAVLTESARAGYDPLFVLGLVSVESSFRLSASSERGASGLMQLMPSTFAWISAREPDIGAEDYAAAEDPVIDVRLAVRYIKWLEKRFHSRDEALMAYNAGPRRLSDHKRSGEIPDILRDYPRRVYKEYRRLALMTGGAEPDVQLASAK